MTTQQRFIAALLGFALAAAVLILMVPSLFRPDTTIDPRKVVFVGGLVVAFGAATLAWRPPTRGPDDDLP